MLAFSPSLEAKLTELLHKICSLEIKLCSDATEEYVKLLRGETGGELLQLHVQKSSNFTELLNAWDLRRGKQGLFHILLLISAILSHPEGRGKPNGIVRAIDIFSRLIIEERLDDIYKELNSKEGKRQKYALLLLASLVRRGPGFASDVAKIFDFKIQGFAKLGEVRLRGTEKVKSPSARKAFVGFAVSFLEVGKPGLLRWIIQQKELYSRVLRGLGKDDDETLVSVLFTLKDRVLVEESSIPPGLRSVLFGSVTLEQLVSISGREDSGTVSELAHDVLVKVCTDPCNGIMPDPERRLRGNPKRLLMLMKMLRATEVSYHRDLLLAIVKGRPSLASAFLDEFPHNVEDYTSPSWLSSISLAAHVISSVRNSCQFNVVSSDPREAHPYVQSITKCICPRPFSRSLINKGLLHSDLLVKHGTLKFLLETLKLLDSFVTTLDHCSSCSSEAELIQASLEEELQNEVRNFFPDSQVLLTLLSSFGGCGGSHKLKRKAETENGLADRKKRFKRSKKDVSEEDNDIIIGGVSNDADVFLLEDGEKAVDTTMKDEVDTEKEFLGIVSEIWGPDLCSKPINSLEDAEMYFYIKLLDALGIYMHAVHNVLDGSFEFFMNLLSNSSNLPSDLQRALLSLLNQYIGGTHKSRSGGVSLRTPPQMYKHLHLLLNLCLFSPHDEVKDLAYKLAMVAMHSTGAFDKSPNEISAWFLFLPGFGQTKPPLEVLEAVQSMSSVVVSFLCDAVSTVGNNLFKQWNIIKTNLSHPKFSKGVTIGFSPVIVCALQKCLRLLSSESKTYSLPEKSMVSLYVCSTLKYLLQTQVDTGLLSSLIQSMLSEFVDDSKDSFCEWRPLRTLLHFSQSLLDKRSCCLCSVRRRDLLADDSFTDTLDEVTRLARNVAGDEMKGVTKAFSSALVCTTTDAISENLASVMTVSHALFGAPFSALYSIAFLKQEFLSKFSEQLVSESSSAFSAFLKQAPFHILVPVAMNTDVSCSSEPQRIIDLLICRIRDSSGYSIISHIKLTLFWFFQIRSAYKVEPTSVLSRFSEICLIVIKHLFTQAAELNLGASSNLISSSTKLKQEVVRSVLCHPMVSEFFESPLNCGIKSRNSEIEICSSSFLTTWWQIISEIDHRVLDLLVLTCENFLFEEQDVISKVHVMTFTSLVERLLVEFRAKLEHCADTEDFTPLLQVSYTIHALSRFISPFQLLDLADSMLRRVDKGEFTAGNSNVILDVGFSIAGEAFESLSLYLHQPPSKRQIYDLLWKFEENNYDSDLLEGIYDIACKFSIKFRSESAEMCLLKGVRAMFKGKHEQSYNVHPLALILSRIVEKTPKDLIVRCIDEVNINRSKLLFYFVRLSSLQLSVFGPLFLCKLNRGDGESSLTDDQLLMLFPSMISYLSSAFVKFEKKYCTGFVKITSIYSRILINGFLRWQSFAYGSMFEEKYEEIVLSNSKDLETIFKASRLGKALFMLKFHFGLDGNSSTREDLLKVIFSIVPRSCSRDEILDDELPELDFHSVDKMINVVIRAVAKISIFRMWIDSYEADRCENEGSMEVGPTSEKLRLINILVNSWGCVVKRSTSSYDGSFRDECLSLCKSLEDFILRSVLGFIETMRGELIRLDSVPFLESLMKSVLLHRYEDSITLKNLREILSTLSEGTYSYAPYLELVISHSQFTSTLGCLSESSYSHVGELFRPVSGVLKHFVVSSSNSSGLGEKVTEASKHMQQLEIIKILRVLLSKCGKETGINLKELHFLLLSSYSASLSEIDVEIYRLMHEIELIDRSHSLNVAESDYLWGKAAMNVRNDVSDVVKDDESEEEIRRIRFRENLSIDPSLCASTVTFFPYERSAANTSSNSTQLYSGELHEKYDPAFILRFAIHSLSAGYIEPLEFASLGLLAVAFASLSSTDLEMRKLGYETLGIFLNALESCRKNKRITRLRLLLLYVQNGVEEQWQRIPSVSSVFAAETSLILLDSSHEHHASLHKFLTSSSRLKLKDIPLFRNYFWSSAVNFRSQRLWELRLLYVGLNSDDDAQIYIRNSILETLMSFYSSPLADNASKGLILQVVKKSIKIPKMARHLVENCGLFSWLSSVILKFTPKTGEEDAQFAVILEIVNEVISLRHVKEWLQRFALEELMELASCLYRLLGGRLVSIDANTSLILHIVSATLTISQERGTHQPHFTISLEGIFHLHEGVVECPELVLRAILMSTPPVDIITCSEPAKLTRFLSWGATAALKCDRNKESCREETMASKFLRWLIASVILGKLYYNGDGSNPESLQSLLEFFEKRNQEGCEKSEMILGHVIFYLQQHLNTNSKILPSVVSAFSLLLLHNSHEIQGLKNKALCSRIRSPPEANHAWRWSYSEAWRDLSSDSSTDEPSIDEIHACQHLLLIFSDMLLGQKLSRHRNIEISGIFESI